MITNDNLVNEYNGSSKYMGAFLRWLSEVAPNTYRCDSVSDLIVNQEELEVTKNRKFIFKFFNGKALVKISNCYYFPHPDNMGIISDEKLGHSFNSSLDHYVDIHRISLKDRPTKGKLTEVLLEFIPKRTIQSRLVKFIQKK